MELADGNPAGQALQSSGQRQWRAHHRSEQAADTVQAALQGNPSAVHPCPGVRLGDPQLVGDIGVGKAVDGMQDEAAAL
ncbi:MAG: hypothetical protein M0T80_11090 [Actinomycetota bacterium]|nr:hypothetical protein [Actinomycetota bacterium]